MVAGGAAVFRRRVERVARRSCVRCIAFLVLGAGFATAKALFGVGGTERCCEDAMGRAKSTSTSVDPNACCTGSDQGGPLRGPDVGDAHVRLGDLVGNCAGSLSGYRRLPSPGDGAVDPMLRQVYIRHVISTLLLQPRSARGKRWRRRKPGDRAIRNLGHAQGLEPVALLVLIDDG